MTGDCVRRPGSESFPNSDAPPSFQAESYAHFKPSGQASYLTSSELERPSKEGFAGFLFPLPVFLSVTRRCQMLWGSSSPKRPHASRRQPCGVALRVWGMGTQGVTGEEGPPVPVGEGGT